MSNALILKEDSMYSMCIVSFAADCLAQGEANRGVTEKIDSLIEILHLNGTNLVNLRVTKKNVTSSQ